MRPTWHFVTPDDIRWMLELTAPRVRRVMSHYYRREELDAALLTRAASILERVLGSGDHLTRAELGVHLARAGVTAKGVRLAMITMHAELEGLICSGAYRGKQLTYALLAERAPRSRRLSRDAALAELTRRFFTSHAPATQRDFAWWSGLSIADAKRGLEINRARQAVIDGRTYWSIGARRRAGGVGIRAGSFAPGVRRIPHRVPRSRRGAAQRRAERLRTGRATAVPAPARHRRPTRRHLEARARRSTASSSRWSRGS